MRLFGSIPVGGGVRLGASTNVGGARGGLDKRSLTILYVVAGTVLFASLFGAAPHKASSPFSEGWRRSVAACDAVHGNYVADSNDKWTCIKQ